MRPLDVASMRPSDITDGIAPEVIVVVREGVGASMRPSDITDGISKPMRRSPSGRATSFNEAVGYYRRNPPRCCRP